MSLIENMLFGWPLGVCLGVALMELLRDCCRVNVAIDSREATLTAQQQVNNQAPPSRHPKA